MTYVALAALVALIIIGLGFFEAIRLIKHMVDESNDRENKTKTELLSVLGKTETVALSFNDERPARKIRYVDDEEALRLQKVVNRDEA